MATYKELSALKNDNTELLDRAMIAVIIKAQTLIDKVTPTAAEIAWANTAIHDPFRKARDLLNYVLAKNNASNIAAITGAPDATLQSNIDDAVDILITGGS